jgi:predicted anti-sigma-YlaC factor YlaD
MNRHLSSRQVSEWLLGERDPEVERHVQGCCACRAQVTRLEEVIRQFGCSARLWGEGQLETAVPAAPRAQGMRPWLSARNLSWTGAALLLVTIVTLSFAWRGHEAAPNVAVTDTAVLEQIDRQVSRAVPRSMEPLLSLVQWDGGSTAETAAPERTRRQVLEE